MGKSCGRLEWMMAVLCALLALEAVFAAPLFSDAAFTLRQARAEREGSVPCRDIYCEYTPLVPTILALVGGEPVRSMFVVQVSILVCILLTGRLARTLGVAEPHASRMALVTGLLILSNEGRAIVLEPFTLVCLLAAATAYASGPSRDAALLSGLWIGVGFWTKQYALLGFPALLIAGWRARSPGAVIAMTAGMLIGLGSGVVVLLALGTEPARMASLIEASAYPPAAFSENLTTAPELLVLAVLALSTISRADLDAKPGFTVPALMALWALLPLYFRGYRHYWQLAIPFLVILSLRPCLAGRERRVRAAQRGAILLMAASVSLDLGRCARDLVTQARQQQMARADRLRRLAVGPLPVLYLVSPAVLAWIDAPAVALAEVGPKFTRISPSQAEARLAEAGSIVWDASDPGADESIRSLGSDRTAALLRRGFSLTRIDGAVRVYTRTDGRKADRNGRE